MGSNGIPLERLVNLDQLDVNFWKINNIFSHLTSKQYTKTHSFISVTLPSKSYFSGMMCWGCYDTL